MVKIVGLPLFSPLTALVSWEMQIRMTAGLITQRREDWPKSSKSSICGCKTGLKLFSVHICYEQGKLWKYISSFEGQRYLLISALSTQVCFSRLPLFSGLYLLCYSCHCKMVKLMVKLSATIFDVCAFCRVRWRLWPSLAGVNRDLWNRHTFYNRHAFSFWHYNCWMEDTAAESCRAETHTN